MFWSGGKLDMDLGSVNEMFQLVEEKVFLEDEANVMQIYVEENEMDSY